MSSLIIVSTHLEILPFLNKQNISQWSVNEWFPEIRKDVHLCVTGVGVPSTLLQLGHIFPSNKIDQLVQLGFAGSYHEKYPNGELVEVNRDCFADLGIDNRGDFIPINKAMPGVPGAYEWLDSPSNTTLPSVVGVTVNTGTGSLGRIAEIKKKWNPDVESMEGAAAMLFALNKAIKCTQIRAISNRVEPRNPDAWNMDLAANNLSSWLSNYLKGEL